MGVFTKSIFILLIAVSTPLLYRQFANDNTIKFMSSYYSNYKLIDRFLRQTAGHIDRAKDYLPESQQVRGVVEKLSARVSSFITTPPIGKSSQDSRKEPPPSDHQSQDRKQEASANHRLTNCPGDDSQVRLWSKDELAKYDGHSGEPDVYLGFLGIVYNVSVNSQHYGSGAEYNVFAGRDATRAFLTGNFTHDLHDDLTGIDESLYSHVESWASFYGSSYPVLGRIEGRFFDSRGCGTEELSRVFKMFTKLAQEKSSQRELEKTLPECNSEWNGELKKGRVWCTEKSGGVERNWAGVPRVFDDGESKRCVCLNQDSPDASEHSKYLELYPNCNAFASECELRQ